MPETDEDYLYLKIKTHFGHYIEAALYGPRTDPVNAAIECLDCDEVITDADRYPSTAQAQMDS